MKKILSIILAAIMLLTMGLSLVSCGDAQGTEQPKDEKKTYTVTVVDEEGNLMDGVEITFSPKGSLSMPLKTEDGKASYKTDKALTASVTGVPFGYKCDNKAISFDENGNATITLSKMPPYTVKVIDQDGNPVAGVWVQMCADMCVPFRNPTDENGVTSAPYADGDYQANITGLPDGYTVDDMDTYYDFTDGEVTIEVTKVN